MTHPSFSKLPSHVAIIMDGNGRWARKQSLSRLEGHKRGVETNHAIIKEALRLNIPYMTFYAFSSENWRRDAQEVSGLMGLLKYNLETKMADFHKEGICLKVIGERDLIPSAILSLIEKTEELTKSNTRLFLQMAISYGSRAEIVHAAKAIAEKVRDQRLNPEDITEQVFEQHLYTAGIPDPDLFIRTSGEQRISNYLLWQLSYAELVFVEKFWPDFTPEDFRETLLIYQNRERRFGTAA